MCDQLTSYYARDRKSKRYDTFTIKVLTLLVHNGCMRSIIIIGAH